MPNQKCGQSEFDLASLSLLLDHIRLLWDAMRTALSIPMAQSY